MQNSAQNKEQDTDLAIDVHDLNKSFGSINAVNGISLQTKKGEVYGFLGPNGGGKTTTIRMICGLLTPDSGFGTCLGYDILTESYLIKSQTGYMTQNFSLYEDLSIYENLDFMARMYNVPNRTSRIQESIEFLGISPDRKDQLTGTLSGGWKQRLALTVAIIHHPKLLLLDEPTAGVDPKARRDFWDEIHRLSYTGITTLVSTHYMDEAERCDRLSYISGGKITIQGTVTEMISQSKLNTWEVTGPNLDQLANELRSHAAIDLVANFGRNLHVSSVNELKLIEEIKQFQVEPYHWRAIVPNLEDVFIKYMSGTNKVRNYD